MLSAQRRLFAAKYVELNFNATQAAIEAGYSAKTAYSQGQRLLKNVEVAAEIQRILDENVMGRREALEAMSEMSRSSIEDFITLGRRGWKIDLDKAKAAGKLHLVKKIRERKDGTIEVELYDKQSAIRDIGKHHGLWKDGLEITINVNLVVELIQNLQAARLDPEAVFKEMNRKAGERAKLLQ